LALLPFLDPTTPPIRWRRPNPASRDAHRGDESGVIEVPMLSCRCPRCGVRINYQPHSAETVRRCAGCGAKVLLPRPTSLPWLLKALLGIGFLGLCCCGVPLLLLQFVGKIPTSATSGTSATSDRGTDQATRPSS